jgi:3-oxoacyl-[acyl-carrier protein] reductase
LQLDLRGKTALVTGGYRGIGAAIAAALAMEGCRVAVVDQRAPAEAEAVLAAIEAAGAEKGLALQADVTDSAATDAVTERVRAVFGSWDILVCNAGITADSMSWKMTDEQFDRVIAVNLKGYFNYNRAAARVFKAEGGGKIVNIASINGLRGKLGQATYAASKGGVIALSKSLARELGRHAVNVNVVAPGMVLTEMMAAVPEKFRAQAVAETVLGRVAAPRDVANLVVFLVSAAARHITGEVVKVDGGQYI